MAARQLGETVSPRPLPGRAAPKTFLTLRAGRHYELEAAWSDYWMAWRRFLQSLQLQ